MKKLTLLTKNTRRLYLGGMSLEEPRYVIVQSFESLRKANGAATLLKAEGFPCFVDIETVADAFLGRSQSRKPYHVVVEEIDLEDARVALGLS